jgi:hypothetical protein
MLNPAMRLLGVLKGLALLCKVISSIERETGKPASWRLKEQIDAVAIPGTAGRNWL